LLYFTRLQMVAAWATTWTCVPTVFARIDLITQLTTLGLQLIVAGHLMKRVGVHVVPWPCSPSRAALGFIGLAMVGSLAALIVFEAAFRAVQRALMRPARETLYTVVSREDKYKAKAFIDTFVYRGAMCWAPGRRGCWAASVWPWSAWPRSPCPWRWSGRDWVFGWASYSAGPRAIWTATPPAGRNGRTN
jgi:hypothetical protein